MSVKYNIQEMHIHKRPNLYGVLKYSVIQKDGLNCFCPYMDSLFAQIGDSNDNCSSSLEVECSNEDETHAAQQLPTQF